MTGKPSPLSIAIHVCDVIYFDLVSRHNSLMGLTKERILPRFPFVLHFLAVYAEVTECLGIYETLIRIVDINEHQEPIVEHRSKLVSDDIREYHDITVQIYDFEIPEPGEYLVQCLVDGMIVCDRRINYMLLGGSS